jgi:predicted ArsR family transcriptional regulator
MDVESFEEQVRGVAALDNPISRKAYRLVVDTDWVSRDAAAEVLGVARSVAAFHLDKLVDAGLLETRFERISGRTGPGAGRPAKLYGRSSRDIELSLPPRRYDLAGSLLADAVTRASSTGMPVSEAVGDVAREAGERIGNDAVRPRGRSARHAVLLDVLGRLGFEPRKLTQEIALVNCPFHSLAQQHRDPVCGMNLSFVSGLVHGLGQDEALNARLAPEPGYCCVRLKAS